MGHMTDYENNLGSVSDGGGTQNSMLGGNRFHGYQQVNNNELYADQSYAQYTDFRVLPPKTSPLRRPYKRYRLTRRLGAGKFSDVFEAVDVVWENARKREIRRKNGRSKRKLSFRGSRELGGLNPDAGGSTEDDSTEGEAEDWEDGDKVDPRSLVVLKVNILSCKVSFILMSLQLSSICSLVEVDTKSFADLTAVPETDI